MHHRLEPANGLLPQHSATRAMQRNEADGVATGTANFVAEDPLVARMMVETNAVSPGETFRFRVKINFPKADMKSLLTSPV